MPVYDYKCECGHIEENVFFLTIDEMEEAEEVGVKCPACGGCMSKLPSRVGVEFGVVHDARGQAYPGSKVERRRMMAKRYKKRNKRLENLPPDQKKRMKKFFDKHNVKKTPPSDTKML